MQNTHGEICLLHRLFTPFVLSRKYSFRSFDLFTMVFLRFLVTKLKSFARIIFFSFFFWACLSWIDRKISLNFDKHHLNQFSIIHSSILSEIPDYQRFLFFVENFQNRNDHFMEIWYTCFFSNSVLKSLWTICKKKIYTWWIIRIFEICLFFKKAK